MNNESKVAASILIVDDDESFRKLLATTVHDEGYEVEDIGDAQKAIVKAREKSYDIILLDVKMPGMTGIDALKVLKKESPMTDYIMLTGVHDISIAVEAVKLGAREFLTKPFESEYLLQQLRSTLRARAAENKLREAEANFSSKLLYDLRNPLSTIQSGIGFLQKGMAGPLSDQQQVVLGHIGANTEKILTLLSDMIDLSKFETGKVEIEKTPVNFDEFIPRVCEEFATLAKAKKINFSARAATNLPTVIIDIQKVGQVVKNLLDNAIKYTNEGGSIGVDVNLVKPDTADPVKEYVEIKVKDTGAGISAEELPFVFDKYKEFLTGKASAKKTTGLGLAICRNIVEAHRGRMWVDSEVNRGSTFTVLLPV
jgi:two-component system, sensor histidine kinase and response regulator